MPAKSFEEKLHGTPLFFVPDATDERIHLVSRIHLAKRKYQLGLYLGNDGRRHLGFDVAERQNVSDELEKSIVGELYIFGTRVSGISFANLVFFENTNDAEIYAPRIF